MHRGRAFRTCGTWPGRWSRSAARWTRRPSRAPAAPRAGARQPSLLQQRTVWPGRKSSSSHAHSIWRRQRQMAGRWRCCKACGAGCTGAPNCRNAHAGTAEARPPRTSSARRTSSRPTPRRRAAGTTARLLIYATCAPRTLTRAWKLAHSDEGYLPSRERETARWRLRAQA